MQLPPIEARRAELERAKTAHDEALMRLASEYSRLRRLNDDAERQKQSVESRLTELWLAEDAYDAAIRLMPLDVEE